MSFGGEEKIFENNVLEKSKSEKRGPNIYSIPKYEYLQNHLKYKILIDCIQNLHKQKVSLVDYGCGNAQLTRILEMLNNEQELKNIKIQVIGYEVEDIAMGNMEDPTQAMKFLVKAKHKKF